MWIFAICISIIIILVLKYLNRDFYLLALCKRVKTVDGSRLETKIVTIPGKTIFGNAFDLVGTTPEQTFNFLRENTARSKGKSYLMHFPSAAVYNVTTAEDAEEVFQSRTLITKGFVYDIVRPFLGLGLLISTDELWQYRRKLLTPAFHFNILQTFLEVFKEESQKVIAVLEARTDQVLNLQDIIPQFTLNNVCETALGVKLDDVEGSADYRKAIHDLEPFLLKRLCNPLMYPNIVYRLFGEYHSQKRLLRIVHEFSNKIIAKRRREYQKTRASCDAETLDEFGKKKRYAMLDTLLDAESQGFIDNQGICDEVNTFMFEGYDTTSACLMFALLRLAHHQDIQRKCFEEIQNLGPIDSLTVFDLNKLDYLECVIKETLRLYPSVPFLSRTCTTETIINGLVFPKLTQIDVHVIDILRDERHFPDPTKFDPERFRPENTTHRHPFAYVPFSAGSRNCIGQKFAMLEIKVLLSAILGSFLVLPVTSVEDVVFQNGLVLRAMQGLQIKIRKRI